MKSLPAFMRPGKRAGLLAGSSLVARPHGLMALSVLSLFGLGPIASAADLSLWYRQPASAWHEALPVGNGRLGAMVFGHPADERVQLNEATVWSGRPHDYDRAGAHQHLPEIRRLLFAGRHAEAEALVNRELLGERPLGSYQPLGDLRLAQPGATDVSEYRRELDLDAAVVRTSFRADGTRFTREVFASTPHQVLVVRLTCDQSARLSFSVRLLRAEAAECVTVPNDTLELRGQADRGKPTAGVSFVAQLRAVAEGGTIESSQGVLRIERANAVTLLISAATDYRDGDPVARCVEPLAAAARVSYEALCEAHLRDHRRFFRRVSLELGVPSAADALPTDERLRRFRAGDADERLLALYFHYGRYLLIGSSRPGNLPANLQGIWNEDLNPPWFCGWHFDVNAQMNYWLAETTNLSECHEPLFGLIENLRANGRKTARDVYGARGFVAAHRTNAWRFTSPVKGLTVWPPGAAWLCQHLWEHYRFTQGRGFLEQRGYPLMKEAAEFFLDWLVPDPRTGRLVSGPSFGPGWAMPAWRIRPSRRWCAARRFPI